MTNSYQSFSKDGTFDPVEVPDLSSSINQNLQALRQSQQKNIQDAYVRDKSRADNLAKAFQGFGEVSSQLGSFFQKREEAYREKETARMENELYNQYLQNPEGFVRQGFEEEVEGLKQLNNQTEDLGSAVYEATENHETAQQVVELSGWREVQEAKIRLNLANRYYESWLPQQLMNANVTDQATRGAAISQARMAFMKEFGLSAYSDDLLGSVLYPEQQKLHAKLMKEGSANDAQKASFEKVARAQTQFEADMDMPTFVNAMANSLDENGKVRGYRRGFAESVKHIQALFKAGKITDLQLQSIRDTPMPGMGGKTYGQLKGALFENLESERFAEEVNNFNEQRDRDLQQARELEQQFIEEYQNGYRPTDEDLDALQERYRRLSGGLESSRITAMRKDTASAQVIREANKEFENLAVNNLLTVEQVLRVPSKQIHDRWLPVATNQDKARTPKVSGYRDQIKKLVAATKGLKVTADGKTGHEAGIITMQLEGMFDRKFAELLANAGPDDNIDNLAEQAYAEVFTEFERGKKDPTSDFFFNERAGTTFGFKNLRDRLAAQSTKESVYASRSRRIEVDQLLGAVGKNILNSPGAILSASEMEQLDKDITVPGRFRVPEIVKHVANKLGLTPMNVLNQARAAMDMPPLVPPPSLEYVDSQLSPVARALLYQYPTANRSIRGLVSSEFNPAVVPGGYGDKIQEAANTHGIPASILAGLLEQESGYRPDVIRGETLSSAGAAGIAQFMPATAEQYGVDPLDTDSAIDGAARYLAYLVKFFDGDLRLAIYAYNGGEGNVSRLGPGFNKENAGYYDGVIKKSIKYGNSVAALNDPATMRPTFKMK